MNDLRDLLTIDVAAELRKLCQAQVHGPWQVPAELVRRAIEAGARHIDVRFGRRWVVVTDDGPPVDPEQARAARVLVDRHRPDEERHQALTILERAGALALMALAGLGEVNLDDGAPVGTRIAVRASRVGRRAARRWLMDVARFAPVSILVDGRPLPDALAGSLARTALQPPLRGQLALMPEGDVAHAYLVAHGLVTAHLTVPATPAFVAALELGGGDLDPNRLRDAALPHLPALVDQAVGLIAASTPRSETARARLARLALQAARHRHSPPGIEARPLFRTADGALVDLRTLRAAATRGPLQALSPHQPPARHVLGPAPVLVADEAERSLLAEVLGARFTTPSPRASASSLHAAATRLLRHAGRAIGTAADLLRHPIHRRPLADESLAPSERALVAALRAEVPVAICEGRGRPRRARGRVLQLPRDNPIVVAAVRAYAADPSWLRLIRPALLGTAKSPT
jgi:hypothetical protein